MAEPILKATGLNKSFGAVHVLHDVDFAVYPGEMATAPKVPALVSVG